MNTATPAYAGFWIRLAASIIDSILALIVLVPLLGFLFGWDSVTEGSGFLGELAQMVLSAVVVILFWQARQGTPGKFWLGMRIVDASSGGKPTTTQWIIRYVGYYISMIPLFLGFAWVAFDARKQGWHDKLAGTLVVRDAAPETAGASEGKRFAGDPKRS